MAQDAYTLFYTALELNTLLGGAKINRITQPNKDEVFLLVYTNAGTKNLVLSANAESCRVCFSSQERQNPKVAPNFCMLLRKHVSGATIESVKLVGYERILEITFSSKNDFRENVTKVLYCEIMGKYSNLILTENGIILGCLKNPPIDAVTSRLTISGAKYTLPKPQDKADIYDKAETVKRLSLYSGGDEAKFLFENVKGLSYPTAAEAALKVFPFSGAEQGYEKLYEFLLLGKVRPNIAGEGKLKDVYVTDYLSIGGEKKFFEDISSALDEFYTAKEKNKAFNLKQKSLADKTNGLIKKLTKRLQNEEEKIAEAEELEDLKLKGELITANLWRIESGKSECTLENYYDGGAPIKIALDKNLTPNQNAQKYYKKYAKEKRTLDVIIPQRDETKAELEYLYGVLFEINEAKVITDFSDIESELIAAKLLPAPKFKKKQEKESQPRIYNVDGFAVKCGKNNVQNDRLTSRAFWGDMWLHTKNYHSAHVIIETKGEDIPNEVIEIAAEICAFYSDAGGGGKVPVDYALKKFVKKTPQSKPGSVIYTNYKTCYVTPSSHEEFSV